MPNEKKSAKSSQIFYFAFVFLLVICSLSIFIYYLIRVPIIPESTRVKNFFSGFSFSNFHPNFFYIKTILYLFLIIISSNVYGNRILTLLKIQFKDELANFVFSSALGLFFLSLFVFFSGILGGIDKNFYLIVLLIPLVSFLIDIVVSIKSQKSESKYIFFFKQIFKFEKLKISDKIFLIIILLILLFSFLNSLTYPHQSDGVRYHLTAPDLWLKAGKIYYIPHIAFSNFPFTIEMLYLLGLTIDGPILPKLIHFYFLIFTILTLHSINKNIFANRFGLLPIFIFITTPCVPILASWSFIDLGMSAYLTITIYALILWFREKNINYLILCGIVSAGLLGTKYTMVMIVFFISLIIIIRTLLFNLLEQNKISNKIILAIKYALIYSFITFLLASNWYIRNLIDTGNPVYPLAYKWFDGKDWGSYNESFYLSRVADKGFGKDFISFLRLPWDVTFNWGNFEMFSIGIVYLGLSITTIIFIIRIIKALFAKKFAFINSITIFLIIFIAFYIILWFFSYQSNRFLMPVLPIISLFFSYNTITLFKNKKFKSIVIASIILLSIHNVLWTLKYFIFEYNFYNPRVFPLHSVLGFESKDSFLSKQLSYYSVINYANKNLKATDKILFVGEHRGFYNQINYIASDWYDTPYILTLIRKSNNVDDLFNKLKSEGFTHILFNWQELGLSSQSLIKSGEEEYPNAQYYNVLKKLSFEFSNETQDKLLKAFPSNLIYLRFFFNVPEWKIFLDFTTDKRLEKFVEEKDVIIYKIPKD